MFNFLYAMGTPGGAQADANPIFSILPFALVIVVFYFFLIRPQAKKQKEQTEMLKTLKKDDEVITNGGLHGKILTVADDTCSVKFGNNQPVTVTKASLTKVNSDDAK